MFKHGRLLKNKKQSGITLTALVITLVVLIILTFTIAINYRPYSNEKVKSNFKADVKELREEVDQYYARNHELPVINKYSDSVGIASIQSEKNENDNDE